MMKKFLIRTFLFLLPLALLLMGGEAVLRLHPNAAKAKDKAMRLTGSIIDTLILGSSHAYYGLCPELLGRNAYNAAQVSQTLKYDEFILNRYALPRLRAVVLTVSDSVSTRNWKARRVGISPAATACIWVAITIRLPVPTPGRQRRFPFLQKNCSPSAGRPESGGACAGKDLNTRLKTAPPTGTTAALGQP